jgi:hypothetical protein
MTGGKSTSNTEAMKNNEKAPPLKEPVPSLLSQTNLQFSQKKKNKLKMVALLHSMPKNLEEEQQRFFEN